MKIRFRGFFAVILAACAIGWFVTHRTDETHSSRTELRQAPKFALKDHGGVEHHLEEARGKLVIVHFWAAWCPPCLQEIPELVEFAEKLQGESKLQIFAISLDEKWPDAEKILDSAKLPKTMISLLDGGAKTSELYGTYQYPETYLINGEGRIVAKWVGAQPWGNPKTIELMKAEIAKINAS